MDRLRSRSRAHEEDVMPVLRTHHFDHLRMALVIGIIVLAAPAYAAPISAFGGFDHSSGAFDQRTDAWIAGAGLSAAAADVAIAGVRYDDTLIGRGTSLTGAAGFSVAPTTQLRFAATRFIGDQSFRAWRAR